MSGLGYAAILLVLLAVLVLVLVLLEARKKSAKKNNVPEPIVVVGNGLVKSDGGDYPAASSTVVVNGWSKGTIYAYAERRGLWCCPECEGENSVSVTRCGICGYGLSSTER